MKDPDALFARIIAIRKEIEQRQQQLDDIKELLKQLEAITAIPANRTHTREPQT